ncbi:MAG: ABC transporter substrate-binding protein [Nitrospinae bacterium]|nr:ABC transporter substrate-binding protein [Nitrospinota bacterium]
MQIDLRSVRVSVMNAIHDLAVLVASDEGLFRDEGLDVEIVTTPGTAQVNADRQALREVIFDRTMEALYNTGAVSQYRMCEWGVMKRTVEAIQCGQRPAKIVALGAAMSKMAIITAPNSRIYEPEQLKDTPVAVSPFNGSHFTTLKMLEGFVTKERIRVVNAGTMRERLEAVRKGEVAAGNFMEPWISVAQKQGFRILIESHSTRSEAASDDLDGPTLAAMFRAEARAAELINQNPGKYARYLLQEAQGLLEPHELQTWRLLYGPPMPYTRERFEATYAWMLSYPELVAPGASYDTVVDNRAWA